MNERESNELLELGSFVKQGYSALVANGGKVIAAITLTVAVLVTFTDVAFCDLSTQGFTTSLIMMLISSYLMYFSLEDAGEKEGEKSEEYTTAIRRYLKVRAMITPDKVDALRDFCFAYSKREQEYRRLCYLSEKGLSLREYEEYKRGGKCSKREKALFRTADKINAVKLTPAMLLNRGQGVGKSELVGPGRDKILSGMISLIPSTVCTVFTVSIILTAKDGLTAESILESVIQLSALPIVGFRGIVDGYGFVRDSKTAWLETKTRLLEAFLAE